MADSVDSPMEKLNLEGNTFDSAAFDARLADEEAGKIENFQARKQAPQSAQELLTELENEFLTPSDQFSTKWLNTLQRYVFYSQLRGSF
jgi:antiviral helicase SKI2